MLKVNIARIRLSFRRYRGVASPNAIRSLPKGTLPPSCMGAENSEDLLAVVFIYEAGWRRWGRRRWIISIPNILGDIALPEVNIVVGVADIVVPNYRVGDVVAGRRQGLPRAPLARPLRVVVRAAGPGI